MRQPNYADFEAHGEAVRRQAVNLSAIHLQRRAVLGVDPKLVLVFETEGSLELDDLRRAGLTVLDRSESKSVVAFADDPHLAAFLERVDAYRSGAPPGQASPSYQGLLDAIGGVRAYSPEDRLTERARAMLKDLPPGARVRFDVECWHPGDSNLARTWLEELTAAIVGGGGQVVDTFINDGAGMVLVRGYATRSLIDSIATLDQIARIDGLPNPRIKPSRLSGATVENLPRVESPDLDAPIVGLIDSGVRSGHPLIGPAILDAITLSPELADGSDAAGHGTMVAGLLLHGPIEPMLERDFVPRPFCRLLSVRVLDHEGQFPQSTLWERDLEEAIRYCADQGAKIINLSIGDRDTPYRGSRSTPVAALLDQLARELGLVLVVAAGNVEPIVYSGFDPEIVDQYPARLLTSMDSTIIDPAPAALALTVGGTCGAEAAGGLLAQEVVTRRPLGLINWPSPVTRHGPGIGGAIKPELVARAGSFALELSTANLVSDDELACLSAGGTTPDQLFAMDVGTSFAAPLVTRIGAAVASRYPAFGPNLIRALVLQSAEEVDFEFTQEGVGEARRKEAKRELVGLGQAKLSNAIESTEHRVVLVAENVIPVDGVHIYDLPIPTSFFQSGGSRGINVALAFDPNSRARRLDYLSSKMEFHIVRGMTPDDVQEVFLATPGEEIEALEEVADEEDGLPSDPATRSSLGRRLLKLEPSATVRSRGANQLGRIRLDRKFNQNDGDTYLLVVSNTNRWDLPGATQSYALAVSLWRDSDRESIYAELEARLEVPVELEIRT